MVIGLLKENPEDKRVAILPESIIQLIKLKVEVMVESGAGDEAFVSDFEYKSVGAVIESRDVIEKAAEVFIKINPFSKNEISKLKPSSVLIAIFNPFQNLDLVKLLTDKNLTSFSLDSIPRITRAQSMDILSSMATVAGYRAVLDAAMHLPRFFPMFMSAAGTIRPARVLVLGAGVAGLQAIAISRKLGAVVEVFDVRPAVREEVQSLGGKFIEVEGARDDKSAGGYAVEQSDDFKQKQRQLIHDHAIKSNVIIATAQIPGKQAPVLLTRSTVDQMMPGSVVIDLAASTGGNCELTENGKTIKYNQVAIIGKSDYPSDMSYDASKMFSTNLLNFLKLIISHEGTLQLNFDDEIIKSTCLTHNHQILNDRIKNLIV